MNQMYQTSPITSYSDNIETNQSPKDFIPVSYNNHNNSMMYYRPNMAKNYGTNDASTSTRSNSLSEVDHLHITSFNPCEPKMEPSNLLLSGLQDYNIGNHISPLNSPFVYPMNYNREIVHYPNEMNYDRRFSDFNPSAFDQVLMKNEIKHRRSSINNPCKPEERRHECQTCGKRFSRPSSLNTHSYTHTGEKPFSCKYPSCGKKFSVLSNMRRHVKVHENRENKKSMFLQNPMYNPMNYHNFYSNPYINMDPNENKNFHNQDINPNLNL